MSTLTPKQEKFAQLYVELGNASEAYRQAFDASKMKRESIAVKACELLSDANVTVMVQELRKDARERHGITVDKLLEELEEAREIAKGGEASKPQPAAMVSATMGKAKIVGLEAPIKMEHSGTVGHKMTLDDFYGNPEP